MPTGSSIVIESGGEIFTNGSCSNADLIQIGGNSVSSCQGGGMPTFDDVVENGGINEAGILSGNQYICSIGGTTTFTSSESLGLFASGTPSVATVNASSGVITAVAVGQSVITYTKNSKSTTRIVYVGSTFGGTVSGGTTVCSTTNSTILTLSGYKGTIVRWESSTNNFSNSTTISNTTNTLTVSNLVNTTSYRAVIQGGSCNANSTSATIIVGTNLSASVSIAASPSGAICSGTSVTFTATPTNGGTTPSYQWKLNGVNVGTNSTTYTNSALSNNDLVTCEMTSNATPCLTGSPATSNTITMVVNTTNTWTGATSASWFTPSNWSCGSVPTAASDVIIPNVTNKPIIDGTNTTALANTLTVNSGSLTVKSGNTLKVTDAVTNNSGTITFENSASLVQENDNAVNVGAIKYQRLTAPIRQTDYTYWSSPVKPIVGGGYLLGSIATSQNYLSYDSNITNDWKYENASTQMTNGFGYAIQGPSTMAGSPYLATFVGVPNNGNVQVPITYTNPSGLPLTDPDFGISYLLGNPYPSAIDADTFLSTNAGVLDGTLYFWTHNTEIGKGTTNLGSGAFAFTSNDYASYNYTGGVSGTGFAAESIGSSAIAKDIPTGKIAAGQGFFATGIASGTVNFINVMRISGTSLADGSGANQQFFKTKNPKAKTAKIEKNRVWLNLSNTQGAFKQTLIGYVTGATNENDTRFDGQSFDGQEFVDFYSINDGKNLTIQGRALPFDENDEVPLGYRTTITGEFTINIDQVDGSLTNQPVFLEDKLTHTVTDLKSGNYTFNTNAGTFDNRFVLRYKDHSSDKTLGLDETDANDGIIVLYSNNYKTLIIRNNGEATINSVSLFNMTGQNLSVWDIKDWEQTSIQIPIKESSSGIYVVKVKTTMGESSKKIVIR